MRDLKRTRKVCGQKKILVKEITYSSGSKIDYFLLYVSDFRTYCRTYPVCMLTYERRTGKYYVRIYPYLCVTAHYRCLSFCFFHFCIEISIETRTEDRELGMVVAIVLSSLLSAVTRVSAYRRTPASCHNTITMAMSSSKSEISTLVPAIEAMELHKNSRVKFLDGSWHMGTARNPTSEFLMERLPGAQYFSIDDVSDKSSDLPHMMPDRNYFEVAVSAMGISNDDHIIVYVHPNCFSAARVWWMFKSFGHEKVSVLDGGIKAWKEAGGEIISGELISPPLKSSFKAEFKANCSLNAEEVLRIVNNGSAQIVDARSKGRFEGTAPEPRAGLEGGHIPGSLNLPFTMLVKDNDMTTFKSPEEIRDVFKDSGIVFGSKIVLTCGSGVSAANLALCLNLMGQSLQSYPIYDGSWSEWGARSDLPKMK